MLGNGLWQRVWGALPLLDRGNIEVTWVEHFWDKADFSGMRQDVTSMLPVGARGNIGQALCLSVFPSMILPRYLFFWVVSMTGDVPVIWRKNGIWALRYLSGQYWKTPWKSESAQQLSWAPWISKYVTSFRKYSMTFEKYSWSISQNSCTFGFTLKNQGKRYS